MILHRFLLVIQAVYLAERGLAQESGWQPNQVNATMCQWQLPRVGIIRDTAYIDGGYLFWLPGFANGSIGAPTYDGNPLGIIYLLNFSAPFNTSSNMSQILQRISKAPNGGAANNIGPEFYDGAMLANDYEWLTYGGLLALTDAYHAPASNIVLGYEKYESGPSRQFFSGFISDNLPTGVTRYVTAGAAVSVPSENKGFYFGGLRSSSYGPIYYTSANETLNADELSETLISVDMSVQGSESWSNQTLPTSVPGRANAELVFVPVSTSGVLVALGGVINPVDATVVQGLNATQKAESQAISPGFMSNVSVYDIATGRWFTQETSNTGPGALTQGCTVVASAPDGSSHNIYWYGGYDGIDLTSTFYDDVWVLSLPSFTWIKVTSGISSNGRAGHRCVKPYPDQMLVIGGYTTLSGILPTCVTDNIILNYNLTSNEWLESYNPTVWSNYTVPISVWKMIGGSGVGGANSLSPTNWSSNSLESLFQIPYNSTKIKNWYPYPLENGSTPTGNLTVVAHHMGLPTWASVAIGVCSGLIFILVCVLVFILYQKRKNDQNQGVTELSTEHARNSRVINWIRKTSFNYHTATTEASTMGFYDEKGAENVEVRAEAGGEGIFEIGNIPTDEQVNEMDSSPADRFPVDEIGGNSIHEMMDTSYPVELPDTNLS